jgi:hypothetical protein
MLNSNLTTPELLQQAAALVVRVNAVSVSLLQRHFRLGYSDGLGLALALEHAGLITAPGADGYRALTSQARLLHQQCNEPTTRELFEAWAIDPFEGGDGGDPGSSSSPSVWMFGTEHGDAANLEKQQPCAREKRDYSIDQQLRYKYNLAAFKLFAAMNGEPVERFEQFARLNQPWVPGSRGYLKGNLYPYPCRNVSTWSNEAIHETGFERKEDMVQWCKEYRLPAIAEAVRRHRPTLFIGVGTEFKSEFALAFFGAELPLQTYQFAVGGHTKKIRYATLNQSRLVVLPHISSGANGLNSDESIQVAGSFIAGLLR